MSEPIVTGYSSTVSILKTGTIIGATGAITNTSEEDITVNSVGLFSTSYQLQDSNKDNYRQYLLTKTKLDTPLIIKPGETKTITITIDFNKMIDNVNNA